MYSIKLGADLIHFGEGALSVLESLPGARKRAFIVQSGKIMEELGFLEKITRPLEAGGYQWETYTGVEPEPSFECIYEGAKKMIAFEPDWIIGFGGGSAMDAAKVMWAFYENPQLTTLEDITFPNVIPKLREKAKLICIPTSSGTGSEVTKSAVVKDTKRHLKVPVRDMQRRLIPDMAILDPIMTISMPASLTAASGLDAITHAVEAYVCKDANLFSDALATAAFTAAYETLPKSYHDLKNLAYREKMLGAACLGGMAFANSNLGITHSIAHSLGGELGVPHGIANAIVLPFVVEFNSRDEKAKARYQTLASMVGYGNFQQAILDLNRQVDIPSSLRNYLKDNGAFLDKVDKIASMAMTDLSIGGNPIRPTQEELRQLILKIYKG